MTAIDANLLTSKDVHQSLLDRLSTFRRRVRARLLLEGFARLLALAVGLALITFLFDRTFRLSLPARLAMLIIAIIALLIVAWREIILPLRMKLNPLTLAAALDRISEKNDGRMTACIGTVLELPGLLSRPSPPSPAMVERAVLHCHEQISQFDFRGTLDDRRRNVSLAILAASIVLPAIFALGGSGNGAALGCSIDAGFQ